MSGLGKVSPLSLVHGSSRSNSGWQPPSAMYNSATEFVDYEDIDEMIQANNEDFYDDLFETEGESAPNDHQAAPSSYDDEHDEHAMEHQDDDENRSGSDAENEALYSDDAAADEHESSNNNSDADSNVGGPRVTIRASIDAPNPPLNPSSRPQQRRHANESAASSSGKNSAHEDIPSFEDVDWDTFPWSNLEKKTSEAQLALFARIVGRKRLMEMFIEDLGLPPLPSDSSAMDMLKSMVSTYSEEHNVHTLVTTLKLIIQKGLNYDGFPRCDSNVIVEQMNESNQYKNQQLQDSMKEYADYAQQLAGGRSGTLPDAARRKVQEQRLKLLEEVPLWMRKVIVGQRPPPVVHPAQKSQSSATTTTFTTNASASSNENVSTSDSNDSTRCTNPILLAEVSKQISECINKIQSRVNVQTESLRVMSDFDVARAGALALHLQREVDRVLSGNKTSNAASAISELAAACPSVIRTTLLSKK